MLSKYKEDKFKKDADLYFEQRDRIIKLEIRNKQLEDVLKELEITKRQLDEAVDVIKFYANGSSWQSFNLGDDIPMRSDREDHFSVAGMRARIFIKDFFKDKGVF